MMHQKAYSQNNSYLKFKPNEETPLLDASHANSNLACGNVSSPVGSLQDLRGRFRAIITSTLHNLFWVLSGWPRLLSASCLLFMQASNGAVFVRIIQHIYGPLPRANFQLNLKRTISVAMVWSYSKLGKGLLPQKINKSTNCCYKY